MRQDRSPPQTTAPTTGPAEHVAPPRPATSEPRDARARRAPWWREATITLALGAKILLVVLVVEHGRREAAVDTLPVASPAPDFAVESTTGGTLSLGALRGRPVVLVFWATWCGACRDDLPALERLARESGDDFAVMMVSREPVAKLARFAAERRLGVAMGSDRVGRAFAAYGVESLPMTVIVDAYGRIAHDFVGQTTYEALRGHIDRLR